MVDSNEKFGYGDGHGPRGGISGEFGDISAADRRAELYLMLHGRAMGEPAPDGQGTPFSLPDKPGVSEHVQRQAAADQSADGLNTVVVEMKDITAGKPANFGSASVRTGEDIVPPPQAQG
jgi:hypothetical protein